jgi:hypothetical protein
MDSFAKRMQGFDIEKMVDIEKNMSDENSIAKFSKDEIEDYLSLLPMLADPTIMEFVLRVTPCLYFEIVNGQLLQTDDTASDASESLWLMELVNLEFFGLLFNELLKNRAQRRKVPKKNEVLDSSMQLNSTE